MQLSHILARVVSGATVLTVPSWNEINQAAIGKQD